MKGGLFWKLLLAFLVAFFVITQMIWVLVILEPPATTQDAVVAQRAASAVLDAVATALRQRGEIDAVRVRDSLPEVERTKVEILPPLAQPAPQPRSDAFIERQVEGPDGAVFRLRYRYHGATLFLMPMPIVPTWLRRPSSRVRADVPMTLPSATAQMWILFGRGAARRSR